MNKMTDPSFMARLFFFLIVAVFNFSHLSAQSSKADSLKKQLLTLSEDTNRVNTLNLLARELELKGLLSEGKQYATTAKNLAYKLRFDKGLALALANLGNLNYQEGNYKEALKHHFASYDISERINNKPALIRTLSN